MRRPHLIAQADAARLPLRDESVDLIVTSPPYFALRSYQDGDEHYDGQIGAEDTPHAFLEALWAVTAECQRVLKPTGSMFVNLGDKYAGSGGHNNSGISDKSTLRGNGHVGGGPKIKATRRSAPDRYNQDSGGILPKSLLGLPWRYANGCTDGFAGDRLVLRAEIVWNKPNGLPESVLDRVKRSHEQWFHLTKPGPYFSAMDEVREPYSPLTIQRNDYDRKTPDKLLAAGNAVNQGPLRTERSGHTENPLGKLPGSVWTIPTEPLVIPEAVAHHYDLPDHFAAFPQEFPRRFVLGWCPPTGVVLDPFSGTGTVVGVARALGRVGVGIDLSHDYCRLGRWRVERSGHFTKTTNRTDAERQMTLEIA